MDNSKTWLIRLQRLTDGIFVLAMTLMVLQFDLPELNGNLQPAEVTQFLLAQLPALSIYIGTFILIAFYWLSNLEQFKYYQNTNNVHIWLNLFSLIFVVIIPYANDLATVYYSNFSVQAFYSIDLFLVGLFSWLSWVYACHNHRLIDPNLSTNLINSVALESLLEPLTALLAMGVAYINTALWEWTFYLIPLVYIVGNYFREKD